MDRHDEQQGTQPDAGQAKQDLAKRIAEYERTVEAARESLERLKKEAEEAARERQGGEKAAEEMPAEEQKEEMQEAAAQPVGTEEDLQPEAAGEMEVNQPEEQAQGEEPEEPEEGRQAAEGEEGEAEEAKEPEGEEAKEKKGGADVLLDGSAESMNAWKKVGAGEIEFKDGQAHLKAGRDRGLVYALGRRYGDFRLKAQYRLDKPEAPMGVAVRFQDPEKPVADKENPEKKYNYDNQAYVAAHTGFEVSLGTAAEGKTGIFVGIPVGDDPGKQRQPKQARLKADDWNEIELEVRGNDYIVRLNGEETARFTNTDAWRGKPASADEDAGYIGFLLGEEPHPGREAKPAARKVGPLPPQMAGPLLPGGRTAGRGARAAPEKPEKEAAAAELILRRVEVEKLEGAAALTPEEKKKLGKRKLEALHQEVIGALAKIKAKDPGLEGALQKAYGYAVLPAVGRANLVVGVARGYGEVFEKGKPVGFTKLTQLNLGVQVGGQTFIELLMFGTKESLDAFKASPVVFNANAAVAFVRGAAGTANFRDVTAHSYSQGGMVVELSMGGQKFRYMPEPEAIEDLMKSTETRSKLSRAGKAMANFGKKIGSKAGATGSGLGKKIAAAAGGTALGKKIATKMKGTGLGKKISEKAAGSELGKKLSEKAASSGLGKKLSAKAGGLLQRHRPQ